MGRGGPGPLDGGRATAGALTTAGGACWSGISLRKGTYSSAPRETNLLCGERSSHAHLAPGAGAAAVNSSYSNIIPLTVFSMDHMRLTRPG
ncbi:hypothetical protein E2C01_006957 [Portunus trituberculatus]|uniref:Uncharacterized protein n=1 Tax=Portunus trituberculatus TaxID=210409 RepID=A0A5B7CWJ2_PORTR|nr:hypothetical protein [Portunus trituberculatus]